MITRTAGFERDPVCHNALSASSSDNGGYQTHDRIPLPHSTRRSRGRELMAIRTLHAERPSAGCSGTAPWTCFVRLRDSYPKCRWPRWRCARMTDVSRLNSIEGVAAGNGRAQPRCSRSEAAPFFSSWLAHMGGRTVLPQSARCAAHPPADGVRLLSVRWLSAWSPSVGRDRHRSSWTDRAGVVLGWTSQRAVIRSRWSGM